MSSNAAPEAAAARRPPGELGPGLYVVATPIGNLGDISRRALDVLGAVDAIVCEDSRVTRKLLTHFSIRAPLIAYYEHNAAKVRPELLRRLAAGQRLALVTDAGTPLISDPGYKLVDLARAQGANVIAVPGPSAVTAALSVAGLPTDRFFFAGFLPPKAARRRAELKALAAIPATLVFLESPRRLAPALADMAAMLGSERPAAVARELTKLFEEVRRANLGELALHYSQADEPKGEIVVVVGPPSGAAPELGSDAVDAMLRAALANMSLREAAAEVAAATGQPRRQVYARALRLRGSRDGDA